MRLEVEKIHIQIGDVKTLTVENWRVIPLDLQETVEIVGGVAVQDFGRVPAGDKFSCEVTVWAKDKDTIFSYWDNRTKVTVIDEADNTHENMRVVVREYGYLEGFKKYYRLSLEFWRC